MTSSAADARTLDIARRVDIAVRTRHLLKRACLIAITQVCRQYTPDTTTAERTYIRKVARANEFAQVLESSKRP